MWSEICTEMEKVWDYEMETEGTLNHVITQTLFRFVSVLIPVYADTPDTGRLISHDRSDKLVRCLLLVRK